MFLGNCLSLANSQMMCEWLQRSHQKAFKMYKEQGNYKGMKVFGKNFRFDQRGRATGLIVDIRDLPPSKEPIWQD